MKKILYVTTNTLNQETYGGAVGSMRNHFSLSLFAQVIDYQIFKKSNLKSLLSLIFGYYPPSFFDDINKIESLAKKEGISCIFFDGSQFGKLVKIFHKKSYKTIVYFNNCEFDFNEVRFGKTFSIKKILYRYIIKKNENYACDYGDIKICITERDKKRLVELYDAKITKIIPLTIIDKVKNNASLISNSTETFCLLLGPATKPNIDSYYWFIKNVSPFLLCKTLLVGKGFESYKKEWSSDLVEIVGYVDSVEQYYANANFVAIPLLSGSGMKIKTAEALMYGKYIFGTDEAFIGYVVDEKSSQKCNNANEFIEQINKFLSQKKDKFNSPSRKLYQERYATQNSILSFMEIIDRI